MKQGVSRGGGQSSAWLARALLELRMLLIRGEVYEAKQLADQIGTIGARSDVADADLAYARACRRSVGGLLGGIEAFRTGDCHSALALFLQLTSEAHPPAIRWIALWWWAWVAAHGGEIEGAEDAAVEAMGLSRDLDPQAVEVTQCLFARLEALDGAAQPALDRIALAIDTFERRGERRGLAFAWLTRARILASVGMDEEAVAAAENARDIDTEWSDPLLFLSQRALKQGEIEQALLLLETVEEPRPTEVLRDRKLLELAARGQIPAWVIAELQDLREQLPSEAAIGQLRTLSTFAPDLMETREVLAWKLFMIGRFEEAEQLFEEISWQALDAELEASVLLGLRCATNASRRQELMGQQYAVAVPAGPEGALQGDEDQLAITWSNGDPEPPVEEETTTSPGVDPVDTCASKSPAAEQGGEGDALPGIFVGDLGLLPVPDLLDFLGNSRRSGLLMLVTSRRSGTVCLRDGQLAGATSPGHQHIGHRLHDFGVISGEQLRRMRPVEPFSVMGWAPLPDETIPADVVRGAFISQIREAVGELVAWDAGQFSFQPVALCPSELTGIDVALDTQEILLDALRRMDERTRT